LTFSEIGFVFSDVYICKRRGGGGNFRQSRGLDEADAMLRIALVFMFIAAFLSGREQQAPSIFRTTCAFD